MSWAVQHLRIRLRPIHRVLRAALARRGEHVGYGIPRHPEWLRAAETQLSIVDTIASTGRIQGERSAVEDHEEIEETRLREAAAASNATLPIDRLVESLDLEPFETEAILLCCATELDTAYGKVFAFLRGDSRRTRPSIELVASLTATTLAERVERQRQLGRLGKLRRYGIMRASDSEIEAEADLMLTKEALSVVTGHAEHMFRDPLDVSSRARAPNVADPRIERVASLMKTGVVATVSIAGGSAEVRLDLARQLARVARKPLRRSWDATASSIDISSALSDTCEVGAIAWIDADALGAEEATLAELLGRCSIPAIVTSRMPIRHPGLVARRFIELDLVPPTFEARRALWQEVVEGISEEQASLLAGRYRLDRSAIVAAVELSRIHDPEAGTRGLDRAAAAMAQPRSLQFADVIAPRRGFDDLVLPPSEERQVRELAEMYLVWPRVAEQWGFAANSSVGVKALFTGEPGTGKTLAAEVIAGHLGLSLVRIDLARIVSKWVGETEKNLDAAFAEAEESSAVLFFDEAEALFGKRGEVRHGTDRYANLEVSFLLQRLERHDGLVILASNLRDEIDPAFVRRFQHVVHFPRPAERERRRLWRLAFPSAAPLAPDVDLSVFARLDLTGAGIVSSARMAALNAARAGASAIGIADVVEAVTGQFQREARALTSTDLGPYAAALRTMRAS